MDDSILLFGWVPLKISIKSVFALLLLSMTMDLTLILLPQQVYFIALKAKCLDRSFHSHRRLIVGAAPRHPSTPTDGFSRAKSRAVQILQYVRDNQTGGGAEYSSRGSDGTSGSRPLYKGLS